MTASFLLSAESRTGAGPVPMRWRLGRGTRNGAHRRPRVGGWPAVCSAGDRRPGARRWWVGRRPRDLRSQPNHGACAATTQRELRTSPGKRRVGVTSYRATSSRTRTCQTRGAVSVGQLKDMVALLDDPTSPLEGEPITMTIATAFEQIPLTMLRDP